MEFVSVTLEAMVIHTRDVAFKRNVNAHRPHVEKELNAVKVSTYLNVFVRLATMEIRTLAVMTSMNVHRKFAVRMQFASTRLEAMIVDAAKAMLVIHLKCVQRSSEVFVLIQQTVNVVKTFNVQLDLNVNEETAKIFARRLNVVHELLAILELAYVRLVTREIPPISRKAARWLANVKLI